MEKSKIDFYIDSKEHITALVYNCIPFELSAIPDTMIPIMNWSTDNILIELINVRGILQGSPQQSFHLNSLNLKQKKGILKTINKRKIYIGCNEITIRAFD